jgi:hypothetical protein
VRRRIVRLAVALAAITIVIFGVPLAFGVAQYLVVDQYNELERMADSAAIAVSGDLTAPTPTPAGANPATQTAVYDTTGAKVSGDGPDQVSLVADALTGASSRGMLEPPDILDVGAILDGIRQRWHPVLAARGRPLRLAVLGTTPHARVGASALSQILDVLIDNADQHGAGAITVTVRTLDDAVAIDVADEGPRLLGDPAVMFERRTGPAAGHGIGLALARRLAEAQGGRLRLAIPGAPGLHPAAPVKPSCPGHIAERGRITVVPQRFVLQFR